MRAAPRLFSPYENPQAYKASSVNCQYFLGMDHRCRTVSVRSRMNRAGEAYQRVSSATSRLRQKYDIRTTRSGVRDIEAVVCVDEILRARRIVLSVGSRHCCNKREELAETTELEACQYGNPEGDVCSLFVCWPLAIIAISYRTNPLVSLYSPIAAACNCLLTPLIKRWSVRYLVEFTD